MMTDRRAESIDDLDEIFEEAKLKKQQAMCGSIDLSTLTPENAAPAVQNQPEEHKPVTPQQPAQLKPAVQSDAQAKPSQPVSSSASVPKTPYPSAPSSAMQSNTFPARERRMPPSAPNISKPRQPLFSARSTTLPSAPSSTMPSDTFPAREEGMQHSASKSRNPPVIQDKLTECRIPEFMRPPPQSDTVAPYATWNPRMQATVPSEPQRPAAPLSETFLARVDKPDTSKPNALTPHASTVPSNYKPSIPVVSPPARRPLPEETGQNPKNLFSARGQASLPMQQGPPQKQSIQQESVKGDKYVEPAPDQPSAAAKVLHSPLPYPAAPAKQLYSARGEVPTYPPYAPVEPVTGPSKLLFPPAAQLNRSAHPSESPSVSPAKSKSPPKQLAKQTDSHSSSQSKSQKRITIPIARRPDQNTIQVKITPTPEEKFPYEIEIKELREHKTKSPKEKHDRHYHRRHSKGSKDKDSDKSPAQSQKKKPAKQDKKDEQP